MADAELLVAIEAQAQATWRQPRLINHHRAHRLEWPRYLGKPEPLFAEYAQIAPDVARHWDRLFLTVEEGGPSWLFVRLVGDGSMGIVVITRGGRIRSTMISRRLDLWVQRQLDDRGAIEVTDRGRNALERH